MTRHFYRLNTESKIALTIRTLDLAFKRQEENWVENFNPTRTRTTTSIYTSLRFYEQNTLFLGALQLPNLEIHSFK